MTTLFVNFTKNNTTWETTAIFCPNDNVYGLIVSLQGKYTFDTFGVMLKKVFNYYLENYSGFVNTFLTFLLSLDRQIKDNDQIIVTINQ